MSNEREGLRRRLEVNGEAGDVEIDAADGSPVCRNFAAQAGPFQVGAPVVVLSKEDADRILSLLPQAQEPVGYVIVAQRYDKRGARGKPLLLEYGCIFTTRAEAATAAAPHLDMPGFRVTVEPVGASPVASAPWSDNVRKTTDPDTFLTFPASAPEEQRLEDHIGLHDGVEISYLVDRYEATLTTHDGASTKATGEGDTIRDALDGLVRALRATPTKEQR